MKFDNIDNKYKDKPEQVYIKIQLVYPHNVSLQQVFKMGQVWGMRLIESSTFNSQCSVAIKKEKFYLLYHEIPKTGQKVPLVGTQHFIKTISVYKIE